MTSLARQSGFTMIELLLVLTLVGIFAATAMAVVGEPLRQAALDSSYATVVTALDSARSKSMQGFGDGSEEYYVKVSSDGKQIETNTGTITLSPTVTASAPDTEIRFERISGHTTPQDIVLGDSYGNTATITVTSQGYVHKD